MPELFETTQIGSMKLSNRFVRSATWEGLAREDGGVTQELIDRMTELARGRVGLIVSGHAFVRPEGQAGPRQMGIHDDTMLPGLRSMCEAVHAEGGVIACQLAHAGCRAATPLTGLEAVGPSSVPGLEGAVCREMTEEDIAGFERSFAEGAERAKKAGFDAVQIHCAHGYGLSQFLSPRYNRRTDGYGGSLENRVRIVREVVCAVRAAVGGGYPVLAKINSEDFAEGGLTQDEMIEAVRLLEAEGLDAVELSGGLPESGRNNPIRMGIIRHPEHEGWYKEAARRCREAVSIPVMLVGGIRSYARCEKFVREGFADYIALSRPLIREPDLVKRWEEGDRAKAACLNDNLCFKPARAGEGIYCVVARRLEEKEAAADD